MRRFRFYLLKSGLYWNSPDDGFSTIPYEKGYQFLVFLEEKVGEDTFREIMSKYIDTYKYKSAD